MMTTVAFIGAGRVARQLAFALQPYIQLEGIYSRTGQSAQALAQDLNVPHLHQFDQMCHVDAIVICVQDDQISVVAQQLANLNYTGLVIHTSGSTPLQTLSDVGLRAGVFYPLQTFGVQSIEWRCVPLLIEAQHATDLQLLRSWAKQLSDIVHIYDSTQRAILHVAAIFACNFSQYCIDIAQQLLIDASIDSHLIDPLILTTMQKATDLSAYQTQTGPAMRHDHQTMDRHQAQLATFPQWLKLYQQMSQGIMQRHPIQTV